MANLVINTGETLNADNYSFGSGPNQLWAVLEPAGGNQSYSG